MSLKCNAIGTIGPTFAKARPGFAFPFIAAVQLLILSQTPCHAAGSDWPVYGGDAAGTHYSRLSQINKANVSHLQQSWSFAAEGLGNLQTQPLAIDGIIYAYTPSLDTIALDGATGRLLWRFSPGIKAGPPDRGFAWWSNGDEKRLFAAAGPYVFALDPASGKPIANFGENGRIDLRNGLGRPAAGLPVALTTPGIVVGDLLIMGFRTTESAPAAPGDIRAFDVHSGALRWSFHTIPHPGEPGYESWPPDYWKTGGGANNWAGMAADVKRGIVYVPTGSAVGDFYGEDRVGDDRYANCLLALDARSGRLLWSFQGVHHDLSDRDFPSPPVLLTVRHDGKPVDAVAQATKEGYLFVLDRLTGKPLFPIVETSVPQSDVPGEKSSPSQPEEAVPVPFARQGLTRDYLTTRTPAAHDWAVRQFKKLANDGPFPHMRVGQSTIVFPGFDGGAEWGGQAVDPGRGVLYINASDIAWTGALAENRKGTSVGEGLYLDQCSSCHGADRRGSPPAFPSLIDSKLTTQQMADVVRGGRGRMPAFPDMPDAPLNAILDYVKGNTGDKTEMAAVDGNRPLYRFTGYRKFLDPEGYPAVAPPWGTFSAIDLNTGRYLWKITLGGYPELSDKTTGSENYGGPILTAGGVLFIGATVYDKMFRAFDAQTGKLLWHARLPYAGNATPITYMAKGRQYVLIQTDNGRDPKAPQGAAYVAFALPR